MNETDSLWLKAEMADFETFYRLNFPPKGGFLSVVSRKVVESGGKRLRPAFTILFAGTSGEAKYDRDRAFRMAAAVETLHTATLVHDDIIDGAQTRRGAATVNAEHGTNLAVYTGDYLLVRTMSFLAKAQVPYEKISYVTNGISALCMGEVDQYYQRFHIPTFTAYLKRILRKTGILFSAACALGAECAGLDEAQTRAAARFGLYYGGAFQIADDLLDMESTQQEIGKPAQNDLKEGIITLPALLAALHDATIRDGLQELFKGEGDLRAVSRAILDSTGVGDARAIKARYIAKALKQLDGLPETKSREILAALARQL